VAYPEIEERMYATLPPGVGTGADPPLYGSRETELGDCQSTPIENVPFSVI
jgi:hypothetical protein